MITNDKGIVELKHFILREVCRLAWEDRLNAHETERIVYEVSPGPKSQYRCCVYKEREIVRGRIRLAQGESPEAAHYTKNVVAVIPAACDDCPIQDYFVTDICRFCLGKACLNSCRFGALTPGDTKMRIDPNKCKSCGLCAKACPYGAIIHQERPCKKACPVGAISYDEAGICKIDENKCIHCGHCIHNCPFGAIGSKIFAVDVIKAIREGRRVVAMCAPATEGQFGKDVGMASVRAALMKVGFADMVEVGLGGDMTAAYEALEWIEARKAGKIMTTSCCPAFISMLRHHFPKIYEENKSATVSPMTAVSRYLKYLDPDCVTVFIGPCIAKKGRDIERVHRGPAGLCPDLRGNGGSAGFPGRDLGACRGGLSGILYLWQEVRRQRRRSQGSPGGHGGDGRGHRGHPSHDLRRWGRVQEGHAAYESRTAGHGLRGGHDLPRWLRGRAIQASGGEPGAQEP